MLVVLGAFYRAIVVALIITAPAVIVPNTSAAILDVSVIVGAVAGSFILFEYAARNPGFIEFRYAPPYNRVRFFVAAMTLIFTCLLVRAQELPGQGSATLYQLADNLAIMLDGRLSPINLAGRLFADQTDPELAFLVRQTAAFAIFVSFTSAIALSALLWAANWPVRRDEFNLWINMPTIDPTDPMPVEKQLGRLAIIMAMIAIALPNASALVASRVDSLIGGSTMSDPVLRAWGIAIWAIIPAALLIRAAAIMKIARLVKQARTA